MAFMCRIAKLNKACFVAVGKLPKSIDLQKINCNIVLCVYYHACLLPCHACGSCEYGLCLLSDPHTQNCCHTLDRL